MKYVSSFLLASLLLLLGLSSCTEETYADKRNEEKDRFESYLQENNIEVIATADSAKWFRAEMPWPENTYYKTYRGAYVRMISNDTTRRATTLGCEVTLRYNSFDLDGNQLNDNQNVGSRDGLLYVYTPGGTAPFVAVNDVTPMMHHSNLEGLCQMDVLIDSQLGSTDQQEAVITVKMEIKEVTVGN